jgi:hypothetical protein
MTEHMGVPHFPDDWENSELKRLIDDYLSIKVKEMQEEKLRKHQEIDDWIYACTFGDKYEVITRPDGTLTVREKDE